MLKHCIRNSAISKDLAVFHSLQRKISKLYAKHGTNFGIYMSKFYFFVPSKRSKEILPNLFINFIIIIMCQIIIIKFLNCKI